MLKRHLARLLALFALASAGPAWATSVLPMSFDKIVDKAAIIFEGTCVDNRTERDPATNMIVTYTTFTVSDVIKGEVGSTHTVKQVGGRLPDEDKEFNVEAVPKFTPGKEYVVFLYGTSRSGFSSPVGLAQGRFWVEAGPDGRHVTNGRDFREMIADIPEADLPGAIAAVRRAPQAVRRLELNEFKRLVRARSDGR
jgi:hypothetical protein